MSTWPAEYRRIPSAPVNAVDAERGHVDSGRSKAGLGSPLTAVAASGDRQTSDSTPSGNRI